MNVRTSRTANFCMCVLLSLIWAIWIAGCGGSSGSTTALAAPTLNPVDMHGQWQIVMQSATSTNGILILNANLSQKGPDILADKSAVVLVKGGRTANGFAYTAFGGSCDANSLGQDEIQGKFTDNTGISFTVTESGSLGTGEASATATTSSDGKHIASGSYTAAAACGFNADNGSIKGVAIKPFTGSYSGTLTDGVNTDKIIATISQTDFNVNLAGNDGGTPLQLHGTATGGTFDVGGNIGDRSVEFIGVYEPDSNDFRIFNPKFNSLGTLSAGLGTFPVSVAITPTSTNVQFSHSRSFNAVVSPDFNNQGVTWSLSGAGCAGATCGSLSTPATLPGEKVMYTAPSTVPNPPVVTITATAVADTSHSASASITVTTTSQVVEFGQGQTPNLIVDPLGNVDASWIQTQDVAFAQSVDNGNTFANASLPTPANAMDLQLGADAQGHVDLLWEDFDNAGPNGGTFLANSADGGKTVTINNVQSVLGNAGTPNLVVLPNGSVDITEIGNPPMGIRGIFSEIFTNGGQSSQPPVDVADDVRDVDSELTSASGPQSQIYVAWVMGSEVVPGCAIMFSRSLDGGATFSSPLNVSNNSNECAEFVKVSVDAAGGVNLAWTTLPSTTTDVGTVVNPNFVLFARSTDQGGTFSTPVAVLGTNQFAGVGDSQVAVESGGGIDMVFDATTSTDALVLFARSTDGGATFTRPQILAASGAAAPSIDIDSCGGIDVVWTGSSDLFFSRSVDGATFSAPSNLSNAQKNQFHASIAADSHGFAYTVWDDSSQVFFQTLKVCP